MRQISPNTGHFVFLNPTNTPIKTMFNGKVDYIKPFEEVEVQSSAMARHFQKKCKERGLVNITFTEGEKLRHKDYDAFYNAKCLEGLHALRDYTQLTLSREQQAVNEASLKNNSTVDNLYFKVDTFKAKLKEVQDAIANWLKPEAPKDIPALAQDDEPRRNQRRGKVQAGRDESVAVD